ncbi:MAG: L-serine ammonia-lyase, iron-sulfur-dependent, subunit alpha [Lachnospiraceae bacterium]
MNFTTGQELLEVCAESQITVSAAMKRRELILFNRTDADAEMARRWEIMKAAARESIAVSHQTMGGLIGGEAKKLTSNRLSGRNICGNLLTSALAYSMGVLEVNASMGLIVAAPTAGSSGVIPGLFLAVQEEHKLSDEQMTDALFHAGAVGYLISRNATVAGAEGGCQAEVGTASAMAASAVTELMGGTPEACLAAASTALTNILGLVCDPIGGLVEAPCQKRNGMGVANALISAEMSLSGIRNLTPFDEAVEAMYQVGRSLPEELRETALGGIAATLSGCQLCTSKS